MRATISPTSLTELLDEWRRTTSGSLNDWASFEGLPSYDRERCTRAWIVAQDPFAMLLFLALMRPRDGRSTCRALATRLSFWPPMARILVKQKQWETGERFNGTPQLIFSTLALRTRAGLRQESEPRRAELSLLLSEAVRELVPDPYVFYEREEPDSPALAASRDRDPHRSRFQGSEEVRPKNEPQRRSFLEAVRWSARHGCWSYTLDDDPAPIPRRYSSEELDLAI